ncbi:MAG TPA: LLM class F420-dependent oxidoreductase, partial [Acidimicrobiia bacterium]|nr:LLM class F420-dependent oxidoreductase [Acidimicrobiia bacterium]
QTELNGLSKQGKWVEMGSLITDDMLEAFALVCPPADVPAQAVKRFGDLADRFSFYMPYGVSSDELATMLAGFATA